ncbi:MAG: ornithine cyclodeaminase [Chloroflexota bacterium]|nr:ornithine cyclodeaminase [Chloroflexota bacterium]
MLILSRHDVESLLTMPAAIAAVEEGFRQLAQGHVVMPQRAATPIAPHAGLHLSMPAFVGGEPGTLTIKIVTVYSENERRFGLPTIQGMLLLYDARNGRLLAMMDAEYLTAVRTGAASGVATKYLARPDAATLLLFGAGALAPQQVAAVCAVRPIRRVLVITKTGEKDAQFCREMASSLGIEVESTRDVHLATHQADIICTATNSSEPLFDGNWLKPGTHINAVGAYTSTMREVDATTLQRSRVFVDYHAAAQAEAGDLLIPIANQEWTYDQVAGELGAVINGDSVGRTHANEITLFKSVGLALQDAVTAAGIYALAVERAVGQVVEL